MRLIHSHELRMAQALAAGKRGRRAAALAPRAAVPRYDCGERGQLTAREIAVAAGLKLRAVHGRIQRGVRGDALAAPYDRIASRANAKPQHTLDSAKTCGHKTIFLALRIAQFYADRIPSAEELMRDFEMSKATAYRWRAAFLDAKGVAP